MRGRAIYAWVLIGANLAPLAWTGVCVAQQPAPSSPTQSPTTSGNADRPQGQQPGGWPPELDEQPAPAGRTPGAGGPTPVPPSPLGRLPTLKPAPVGPEDVRFPITLATALRLSDARPLVVSMAQAQIWVAEAELTRAKALWLPDFNFGGDYIRHDGGGPDFNKGILTTPSVNFFYAGAGLWGNQYGIIPTSDAIYQPLVARQVLNSRHFDTQASKNDALLETADAYFRVHQYRGQFTGALYIVERAQDVVDKIAALSRDLVPVYEVDRARNMLADLEQQAVTHRQEWRVQSARLTKVLRLDPRAVLDPLEHDHLQITLIDPGRTLDDLMPIALANRPEIASRKAMVQAAEAAIRREKARPLIPVVALTGFQTPFEMLQAGIFGIGANSSLNQWSGRDDFSIQPLFQFKNMLYGNLAMIKSQRGNQSLAIIDYFEAQDRTAEEVMQALARLQSAAVRVYQADRSLRTGIITLNGSVEGLQQTSRFGDVLVLISRPQEAVYALQLLKTAFDEYFTTVADYNRAQFELFHALGYPARELAELKPPGEVQPVPTARPGFLPPVGNGPPPATR
jgi:outer membrane protein TolC